MKSALDVHRTLLAADVPHEVVRLRAATIVHADDLPGALGVAASCCLAVRCYVTDVGLAAVAVNAGVVPDPRAVLDALGARTLRAATPDEVNARTDYAAGLVSPVGLPPGVLLLADTALRSQPVLYCPVGEGGVALGIRTEDLLAATGAVVAGLSALPMSRDPVGPWGDGARVIELEPRPDRLPGRRRSAG